jgi:hypothetical protein
VTAPAPRPLSHGFWILLAVCVFAFAWTQYGDFVRAPFLSDDYAIILSTVDQPLFRAVSPHHTLFNWYRPVSRELYYWTMFRMSGGSPPPFRLVSMLLWCAILLIYCALIRPLVGERRAVFAACCVATLAFWATPLLWIAGVQELWMLLFALLALTATQRHQLFRAAAATALALLSKESAVVVPIMVGAWLAMVVRPPRKVLVTWLGVLAAVVVLWAWLHPTLRHRVSVPTVPSLELRYRLSPLETVWRTFATWVDLDLLHVSWAAPSMLLARILSGALFLTLPLLIGLRTVREVPSRATRTALVLGVVWTGTGFSVLLLPSIGWHAYYASFGALGFWLGIAATIPMRRWVTGSLIVGLCCLRGLHVNAPTWDWGEAYWRRAGALMTGIRRDLLAQAPHLPHGTRVYFSDVPNNVGLIAGDVSALGVWYRDSSVVGRFYSDYSPDPAREHRFFHYDTSSTTLHEVRTGLEDVQLAVASNPRWVEEHGTLATLLVRHGDPAGAATEFSKLARVPGMHYALIFEGACDEAGGRMSRADSVYVVAADRLRLPLVRVRAIGRELVARLPTRPRP